MTLVVSMEALPGSPFIGRWRGGSRDGVVVDPTPEDRAAAAAHVLVVSRSPVMRRGLGALISDSDEWCRPWPVATAPEALGLAEKIDPSMIVLDIDLCEPATIGAFCAELLSAAPRATLIIVATPTQPAAIKRCAAAGALVCLSPDSDESIVREAFAMARRGQRYVDPHIAHAVMCAGDQSPPAAATKLTPRERDVLQLLSEGCSNRAISSRLSISEKTVKGHVSSILAKLNAPSRLAAALMAATFL